MTETALIFSTTDASRITGLTPDRQRDLRRRKLLAGVERGIVDLEGLLEMAFLAECKALGLAMGSSRDMLDGALPSLIAHAAALLGEIEPHPDLAMRYAGVIRHGSGALAWTDQFVTSNDMTTSAQLAEHAFLDIPPTVVLWIDLRGVARNVVTRISRIQAERREQS